jgi:hypothetical protein
MALNGRFLRQAANTVRQKGTAIIPYALGRFHIVRKIYSAQARVTVGIAPQSPADSLFPDVDVEAAVTAIRRDAVYLPVRLPLNCVAELYELALRSPLRAKTTQKEFLYADVKDARLPNGDRVAMGHVVGAENHFGAQLIAHDPKVIAVISRYLKYTPQRRDVRLYWSFAGSLTDELRRAADQTIQFHFDVHGYNFAYAAYYLTDTDRTNGAHVMVAGSHRDKPAVWLFGSANQTDKTIIAHYGPDRIVCIEGQSGMGFWQDSSCYHKALPPQKNDRLMFQVRYY